MGNFERQDREIVDYGINIDYIEKPIMPHRLDSPVRIGMRVEAYYGDATFYTKDIWESRLGIGELDKKVEKSREAAAKKLARIVVSNVDLDEILY